MANGSDLIIQIAPDEVNSKGWATYYLEDYGKGAFSWVNLSNSNKTRDRFLMPGTRLCYIKGNPKAVPCQPSDDWATRQILLIDPQTKKMFIRIGSNGKDIEVTESVKKIGIVPLDPNTGKPDGQFMATGSGGDGSGGASPFGFDLPFFNVDVWSNIPSFLLWIGAANGGYQIYRKSKGEKIKIPGTAGIIVGTYCGYELIRRKKASNE